MQPALQRRVQRYGWDKASSFYEAFWQHQLRPAHDMLLQMAALQPGENVVDLACGTGLVSFDALPVLGAKGRMLGTDISEKMVEIAASMAVQKNEHRAQFERMDAEDLSLGSDAFDAALCALGLMYMPDPRRALAEMYRVLRPGGRAVAAVWGQRDRCGWAGVFDIVDKQVASEVCPMFFHLGHPGMLEFTFNAAGFSSITTRRISTTLHYSDPGEALGAAFIGGPVALAYHRFSDAVKEEVQAAYLESIRPYRQEEGYAIPGEFVITRGIR